MGHNGSIYAGASIRRSTAKHLIDATPGEGVLIHLDEWFAKNSIQEGKLVRQDDVFSSPHSAVVIFSNKDSKGITRHIHVTLDEIIFVYKGEGEMYINRKWIPVIR